jgi:hypothetical protein
MCGVLVSCEKSAKHRKKKMEIDADENPKLRSEKKKRKQF